jgi:hypothetical protein
MMDVIAQRAVVWIKPEGERVPVTLLVGKPYRANDVDWACPVAADGLYTKLGDIHGIDSFQALVLAQNLLRQLMNGAVKDGGTFRNVEDDSAIDVGTLFASGNLTSRSARTPRRRRLALDFFGYLRRRSLGKDVKNSIVGDQDQCP